MLLIRSSLSNTKKSFQRTIQNVKALFSKQITYQRLPKTPPLNPFTCIDCHGNSLRQSYRDFDRFYSHFTTPWDGEIDDDDYNNIVSSTSPDVEDVNHDKKEKDEMKRCLVTEKLKELEMIDSSDLENVQDIEEVLYLYSQINCPLYVDIFDKFVMDIYSDIFKLKAVRTKTLSSRLHHSSFL